jgi:hypothetical protein
MLSMLLVKIDRNVCAVQLMERSASVHGFHLMHYKPLFHKYMQALICMFERGALKPVIDCGRNHPNGAFCGLNKVFDAVEVGQL